MSALVLTLTDAGYTALVNPANTGTNAILVAEIGVTATGFDTNSRMTSLPGELKRITTFSGLVVANDTIHVTISDTSSDTYSLRGFCLYDDTGVVLALFGQAAVILEKSTQAVMLLSADVKFSNPIEAEIVFGDVTFANPPASMTVPGVTQHATNAEGLSGALGNRSIVASVLKYVMDSRFGAGAPSAFVKGLLHLSTAALFRGSLEIKSAALKDEGVGNELDADLLDGQHGTYYRAWENMIGAPAAFNPIGHGHTWIDISGAPATATRWPDWAEVTNKPAAFNPIGHQHDGNEITGRLGAVALYIGDWDTVLTNGWFMSLNALNSPVTGWLIGEVVAHNADWVTQTVFRFEIDHRLIYRRQRSAGSWGAWERCRIHQSDLDLRYAQLESPAFIGVPTAPTAEPVTNSTQLATTAFVKAAIAAELANYLPKNNPTFTGVMTGPAYNET